MTYKWEFKFLGEVYRFTFIFDDVQRYTIQIGDDYIEHWHKLLFGFYVKSDSWLG